MPRPFPREFRDDVARLAKNRDEGRVTLEQVAADFGIRPMTLSNWLRRAAIDDGEKPGVTSSESAELRAARRRIELLEQENEELCRVAGDLGRRISQRLMYPLVPALAAEGTPHRDHHLNRTHLPPTPTRGRTTTASLGLVLGNTVRSKNVGKDIGAGLKNLVGGELRSHTAMLTEAREQALDRMKESATELCADAVVNVRFTTSQIAGGAAELLAYGTAATLG